MSEEFVKSAQTRLEDMLAFFGINTTVRATVTEETLLLEVDSDSTGRLIGHKGETLAAIQYVMNMMMRRQTTERVYIHVDIAGYKKARESRLMESARATATQVQESGEEAILPPMSAAERRLVHAELSKMSGITTESRGEEPRRRLVIVKAE